MIKTSFHIWQISVIKTELRAIIAMTTINIFSFLFFKINFHLKNKFSLNFWLSIFVSGIFLHRKNWWKWKCWFFSLKINYRNMYLLSAHCSINCMFCRMTMMMSLSRRKVTLHYYSNYSCRFCVFCVWRVMKEGLERYLAAALNTNEMELRVDDQLLLLPMACDTRVQDVNGLLPSNVRSNTEKKWRHFKDFQGGINAQFTCKHVTLAQKNGANFPLQRCPWHSSHIWSSRTYGFTSTRLSMSLCCNWTKRAEIAAM